MTPDEARAIMHEWVANPALRAHMECVALCMAAYADKLAPQDRERWIVCGLLHDFDYERHPTREEHPFVGVKHLESLGVDEDIRAAILGHAT
ncbi:MAG: HDIG domain-containing metalloprotein [bacterium]